MTVPIGHDAQIAAFRAATAQGTLHHAWLLVGPQGVGKAGFAEAAALRLLAEAAGPPPGDGFGVPHDHPIARYFAADSHPDFRRLERLPKEPKLRDQPRAEWEDAERARSITIAQVRGLQGLFVTTPSLSPRRVVLIDAADDLERPAANALLKNLEEPPAGALFLLVSHAPGRLLPTIRSRCRVLRFGRLDAANVATVLGAERPDLEADEVAALVDAGEGSPGRALRFAGLDIAALDAAIAAIIATGDPANTARARLAKALSVKAAQQRYEAFLERVPAAISAEARRRRGNALGESLDQWDRARRLAGSAVHLSLDPQSVVIELGSILAELAAARAA